jgi:hypothetical protein
MLKLNSRREVAEGTIAFEFDKPSGFVFKAGQFAEITWVDPVETDSEGNPVASANPNRSECLSPGGSMKLVAPIVAEPPQPMVASGERVRAQAGGNEPFSFQQSDVPGLPV